MILYATGKPNKLALDLIKDGKIILIDAKDINSILEVESAFLKAKRAFSTNTNIARDLGSEIMVYLYGKRQISEAIKKFGLKENSSEFFLITENNINLEDLNLKEEKFNKNTSREQLLKRLEEIAIMEIKK